MNVALLLACLVVFVGGMVLGVTVAAGFFAVPVIAALSAAALAPTRLLRAMRPALTRPETARTGHHFGENGPPDADGPRDAG